MFRGRNDVICTGTSEFQATEIALQTASPNLRFMCTWLQLTFNVFGIELASNYGRWFEREIIRLYSCVSKGFGYHDPSDFLSQYLSPRFIFLILMQNKPKLLEFYHSEVSRK